LESRRLYPRSVLVFDSTISGNTHGVDNLSDAGSLSLIHNTNTDNDIGIFTESNAPLTEIGR